jgi:signal transduction histidine kinase
MMAATDLQRVRGPMKTPSVRTVSWGIALVIASLLVGVGIYVALHIDSAIDTARLIARPHEVQTALEHTKGTLDALEDSVQDYIIDGAEGMRFQYEDAVRALRAQESELSSLTAAGLSAGDLSEIDTALAKVLSTSRAVIDARRSAGVEPAGRLNEAGLAAVVAANRKLDATIAGQQDLLRSRERALRWDVAQMLGGLVATATIVICVLAGALVLIESDRRRTADAQNTLRSENVRLEDAVRERSETLAQANRELAWFARRALQIQEQERRNLALELHDQIGQELAALVMTLTRSDQELAPLVQPEKRAALQAGIEIARAAYGDIHNLALELRPAMLDRLGLLPTLQWYARQQAKFARCEIVVEADEFPAGLTSEVLTAAYRIVQEAVSNAVRHGNPRRIEIRARCVHDRIELRIRDDGVGFDPDATVAHQEPRLGLGLIGIRQRAHDAGGEVAIRSAPGSGTEIVASLSLPPALEDGAAGAAPGGA